MTFLHVDLCCGLGGWQQPFVDSPQWRSVGLDVRGDLEADVVADVRQLPLSRCEPDLLTMSPTCTEFHKWKMPWHYGGACQGDPSLELVEACTDAVDYLEPEYWVMENVVGLSMYWEEAETHVGPYYLWGHFPYIDVETVYKEPGDRVCVKDSEQSAKIPYHLADGIRQSVEWYL